MKSQLEEKQRLINAFLADTKKTSFYMEELARWAYENELWYPSTEAIVHQLKNELADAARQIHYTDPQGRRVRALHPARYKGKQAPLWDDMREASRQHMETAFQQRRQQIVSDCYHLKQDVDSYNENYNPSSKPIQLELDFTDDVEELELEERGIAEIA